MEASYFWAMEKTHRLMESLEEIIIMATNTRVDIKIEIKELGKSFRGLQKYSKTLDMNRNPDVVDLRLKQQYLQHTAENT